MRDRQRVDKHPRDSYGPLVWPLKGSELWAPVLKVVLNGVAMVLSGFRSRGPYCGPWDLLWKLENMRNGAVVSMTGMRTGMATAAEMIPTSISQVSRFYQHKYPPWL